MNHAATSREAILAASRGLVMRQGWNAVSIRAVASACGVAVGSIYNYFDSKADLAAATVESIWAEILHMPAQGPEMCSAVRCVEWLFACMERGSRQYPGILSLHPTAFGGEDTSQGQRLMRQSLDHILKSLCAVLQSDKAVRPDAFDAQLTAAKFAEILFSMVMLSAARGDYDSAAIVQIVRRTLY